jgi:predicted DNA-binding protein (MmcQ/YjbR family)
MAVLQGIRKICNVLPDTSEGSQFGHPVWRAGKKTFVIARFEGARLTLGFWVGVEQQGLFTKDPRFHIPPYMGHNGWIALDVQSACDWREIENLSLQSYRHFALKRMLQRLNTR